MNAEQINEMLDTLENQFDEMDNMEGVIHPLVVLVDFVNELVHLGMDRDLAEQIAFTATNVDVSLNAFYNMKPELNRMVSILAKGTFTSYKQYESLKVSVPYIDFLRSDGNNISIQLNV